MTELLAREGLGDNVRFLLLEVSRQVERVIGYLDAPSDQGARALLARLSREPRDPDQLVHGAGDVLGRILDEIAFETELDLDRARAALLRAWERISEPDENERARPAAPAASPSTPGDPEDDAARARAIDAFAAGRAAGQGPAARNTTHARARGRRGWGRCWYVGNRAMHSFDDYFVNVVIF